MVYCKLTCVGLKARNFIKRETPAQVFSSEYCEIFENSFSYRTLPVAASEIALNNWKGELFVPDYSII